MNQEDARTQLRLSIRECLTTELERDVSAVGDSQSLLAAGALDSLGVLRLVALIEERYGISVQDDDLMPENFDTIDSIAAFVAWKRDAHTR